MTVQDHVVVVARIGAVERELETILSGRRAVAGGRVTSLRRQDGEQILLEAHAHGAVRLTDLHAPLRRPVSTADFDHDTSWRTCDQAVFVDHDDAPVCAGGAAIGASKDYEALRRPGPRQSDFVRLEYDGSVGRCCQDDSCQADAGTYTPHTCKRNARESSPQGFVYPVQSRNGPT